MWLSASGHVARRAISDTPSFPRRRRRPRACNGPPEAQYLSNLEHTKLPGTPSPPFLTAGRRAARAPATAPLLVEPGGVVPLLATRPMHLASDTRRRSTAPAGFRT